MDRYYTLNADKFLKDSKSKWRTERKKLKRELDSITELKPLQNSEVHGSGISDPTPNTAIDELEIIRELERLDHYEMLCKYAFDKLNDTQKDILTGWYYTNKRINYIVDTFCYKYNCKPRKVYKMRRESLEAFKRALEDGELRW